MSDAVAGGVAAMPDKTDENKMIREKKIAKMISWMTDYENGDGYPFADPVRYKGLVITTFRKEGETSNLILRDIDVATWFNKAKDHELKIVCDFDEAALATTPKSRHLLADAAEPANVEG